MSLRNYSEQGLAFLWLGSNDWVWLTEFTIPRTDRFPGLSRDSEFHEIRRYCTDGKRWRGWRRRAGVECGRDYIRCGGEGREAERNDAALGGKELRREEYMPAPCSQAFPRAFTLWVFDFECWFSINVFRFMFCETLSLCLAAEIIQHKLGELNSESIVE